MKSCRSCLYNYDFGCLCQHPIFGGRTDGLNNIGAYFANEDAAPPWCPLNASLANVLPTQSDELIIPQRKYIE